ncbi:MAG TPA: 30S ribosomal protein S17 [Phycisphaerae bacterium]|nr:30S ribosomal protein S17 [Phycisphaerae bacterium]
MAAEQTDRSAEQRRTRVTRIGVVTSDVREKTISVTAMRQVKHPKYEKLLRRRVVYQVHDDKDDARVGDRVEIMECRPISKTKSWRLVRIIERAPQQPGGPR